MTYYSDDEVIYSRFDVQGTPATCSYLLEAGLKSVSSGGTFITFTMVAPSINYNVIISKCYDSTEQGLGCDVPEAGKLTTGFWAYPTDNGTLQYEVFIR